MAQGEWGGGGSVENNLLFHLKGQAALWWRGLIYMIDDMLSYCAFILWSSTPERREEHVTLIQSRHEMYQSPSLVESPSERGRGGMCECPWASFRRNHQQIHQHCNWRLIGMQTGEGECLCFPLIITHLFYIHLEQEMIKKEKTRKICWDVIWHSYTSQERIAVWSQCSHREPET